MYHIKEDRRSQASAAEIVRGLQECLKSEPLRAITVSDIHRATGISRATFYRLFDTPEDVLLYQLDQMAESALHTYEGGRERTTAEILEHSIALGLENHTFLKALVENGRLDLLFSYTEKSFRQLDRDNRLFPGDREPTEREYVIANLSMAMVASQITWARNGRKESPQELMRYLRRYTATMMELLGQGTAGN